MRTRAVEEEWGKMGEGRLFFSIGLIFCQLGDLREESDKQEQQERVAGRGIMGIVMI